jgi:two-component system nitrate/nitrite response regulator NarL
MTAPRGRRPTAVIAEDGDALRVALGEMLEADGYRVLATTSDGLEAIELLKRHRPDVALLDYRLPGADGVAILDALRRDSPDTRAVMLSAHDETSLRLDATRAGAFAYLIKGCPPAEILQALRLARQHVPPSP